MVLNEQQLVFLNKLELRQNNKPILINNIDDKTNHQII